jgi:xylulokinase
MKIASVGNLNVVTDTPRPSAVWFTYSYPAPGLHYHALGTNAAAAALTWLEGVLGADGEFERLDIEAAGVPAGADGLLFHPYLSGERAPLFDTTLRASFIGLHAGHGRGHMVRAVLEGVALSLAECARVAAEAGIVAENLRLIGGGARSALWGGIAADALGRELVVPVLQEASAGAALIAGAGVGEFADAIEGARSVGGVAGRIEPDPARAAMYARLLELYRSSRDAIAPSARALRALADEGS